MGILARLFGITNASSDVNLLDGNVPTKDQFVIEEPITDSVPDQSCVESQLGAYDRVVELSEVSHYDEAVFEEVVGLTVINAVFTFVDEQLLL